MPDNMSFKVSPSQIDRGRAAVIHDFLITTAYQGTELGAIIHAADGDCIGVLPSLNNKSTLP